MPYTTFTLPSGAVVSVQTSREVPRPAGAGPVEASGVDEKVAAAWSNGMKMVAELSGQAVEQLRAVTASAKGSVGRVRRQHQRQDRHHPC
jgi:hypothetical protein